MLLLDGLMFTHVVALSNVFPIYVIKIKDTKNLWEILLVKYRRYVIFYIQMTRISRITLRFIQYIGHLFFNNAKKKICIKITMVSYEIAQLNI